MSDALQYQKQKELFGHPVGLYILFFTEMWERFSYYGMRALLTLYLVQKTTGDNPGLGWLDSESIMLYGWYTMLVYVMSIPGGIIADRYLGQKRAVLYGAIILCLGHGVLAFDAYWAFFTGLSLIVLGVGLLKPNISTMVGGLYKQGDIRRDKGFSIFYIGINLGSLLATFIVGYVGEEINWHYGFGLAGIAMVLGLLVYLYGQRYLEHVGNKPTQAEKEGDISYASLLGKLRSSPLQLGIVILIVFYAIYAGFTYEGIDNWGYTALYIFIALVAGVLMMIYKTLDTKILKDRFLVLLLSFLLVIVFWGAFEQAGGLMSIYTKTKTDRMLFGMEIPATWFQSLNAGFIILFATVVAGYWAKRKLKGKEASSIFKMAIGTMIMGLGFVFMIFAARQYNIEGSSAMYWLVLAYLFHTIGELCSSPVALSFITKLAPVKYASLMMGVYFAATGLGNKVAGIVGEKASEFGEYSVFAGITIFTVLIGVLVIALLKPLKRLTHGAEDNEREILEQEQYELANEDIKSSN
ncbi:peptide MFS transporter [Aequorivita xiaoshiensis]|uniref:Peptide MFS transporter n=1 Tax=Aequorivita xiaoshiensis TaxID=2874476 RepID=A0A9X1R1V6_9FLAO|nr:peptide MFS transporter [Aequorivita xiaoshiensis]MCG2431200.1 peptide MFS transporter [Aequorivita xiaoshiensis]